MPKKPNVVHRMGKGAKAAQLRCGIVRNSAGYTERDFVTPQYAVVYLHEGTGIFIDDFGREYDLKPGSIFQRFPNRKHTLMANTNAVRAYFALPFQVFDLMHLTGMVSLQRPVLEVKPSKKLLNGFIALRKGMLTCPESEVMHFITKMQSFLLRLLEKDRKARKAIPSQKPLDRAIQILNEDVEGRLSLPQIAKMVSMSYSSFRKQFSDYVGSSPRDYRIRRRIEKAMALLGEDDLLNKEIADVLGYPDEYAFSAQFKKIVGVSPREFKRN